LIIPWGKNHLTKCMGENHGMFCNPWGEQWPKGLLLYGPPGTGKVLKSFFLSFFLSVSRLQFLCMFGTKMAWPQGRDFLWLWVLILCRQAWSMQWLENAKLILLPSGSLSSSSGAPTTWLTFLAHRDTYSKCHKSKTSDFIIGFCH
jgi:hypothetical protein